MARNMYESDVEDANKAPTWGTSTLSLAAYLAYQGHPLVDVTMSNKRAHWIFVESDQLQEDVVEYFAGNAQVEPGQYSLSLQFLRGERFKRHGQIA